MATVLDNTHSLDVFSSQVKEFCLGNVKITLTAQSNNNALARNTCAKILIAHAMEENPRIANAISNEQLKQECRGLLEAFVDYQLSVQSAQRLLNPDGTGRFNKISLHRLLLLTTLPYDSYFKLDLFDIEALFTMPLNEFETAFNSIEFWLEPAND